MQSKQEILAKIESSTGLEKVVAYLQYSSYLRQSEFSQSLKYADMAYQLALELDNTDYIVESLMQKSYAYFYHSEFNKADQIADKVLEWGDKLGNTNIAGSGYSIKARLSFKMGNIGEALKLNQKSLDYYLKNPQPYNLMVSYNNLGTCYQEWKDYEKALMYFELGYKEAEKMGFPGKESLLFNIGCIQYAQKEYEKAQQNFLQAVAYFAKTNRQSNLADAYLNLGMCSRVLEDHDKCREYYIKSAEIKKEINDFKGECKTYESLGSLYLKKGKLKEAEELFIKAESIAVEHDLKQELLCVYDYWDDYWQKCENYEELSKLRGKIIKLIRELDKSYYDEKLSEQEAKHKTEIYKLQSAELTAENRAIHEQLSSLKKFQVHLEEKIKSTSQRLSENEDLLSSQSRMALMGEMISMIAHQWKQPLNIIGVLAQSFEDAWEYDEISTEYVEKQVKLIMEQIFYMSETINDFRNFFSNDQHYEFDLNDVLKKAVKLLEYMLKKSDIKFSMESSENCLVQGNPNELIQVIVNILNNARDAMENSDVKEKSIKLKVCDNDEYQIAILNTGKKIEPEVMEHIFEPYFTTKGKKGTGIGLYICKMIIENKFQGTITASNVDEGVEFLISLPKTS